MNGTGNRNRFGCRTNEKHIGTGTLKEAVLTAFAEKKDVTFRYHHGRGQSR